MQANAAALGMLPARPSADATRLQGAISTVVSGMGGVDARKPAGLAAVQVFAEMSEQRTAERPEGAEGSEAVLDTVPEGGGNLVALDAEAVPRPGRLLSP